jgi:predicted transcriptional regulator
MSKRKQGELEASVLSALWDRPEGLSSQQILSLIGDEELAITTVLTVLSRLVDKGMVKKQSMGRSLLFMAASTREKHTAELLLGAMDSVANPALVFSHFAAKLSPDQISQLKKALEG